MSTQNRISYIAQNIQFFMFTFNDFRLLINIPGKTFKAVQMIIIESPLSIKSWFPPAAHSTAALKKIIINEIDIRK